MTPAGPQNESVTLANLMIHYAMVIIELTLQRLVSVKLAAPCALGIYHIIPARAHPRQIMGGGRDLAPFPRR